jgi:hypothetical protein
MDRQGEGDRVALQHEFILRDMIPKVINYRDVDKSEMVIISDDFILENQVPIRLVKMYNPSLGVYVQGLVYHGETVLETKAAIQLKKELLEYCTDSDDLRKLVSVLDEAISKQCYVIHFGI